MNFQDKIDELKEQGICVYDLMECRFEWKSIFMYILDWRYRKAVNLPNWLKEQVETYNVLNDLVKANKWDTLTPEKAIVKILEWCVYNCSYGGDLKNWGTEEHWNTALESYNIKNIDCEDFAILIYVLARKSGIPANRVRIVAGDVKVGNELFGHAWLEFSIAPFNYVIDGCYWTDLNDLENRKPYIIGRSNYKKIWFAVNEKKAFGEFIK